MPHESVGQGHSSLPGDARVHQRHLEPPTIGLICQAPSTAYYGQNDCSHQIWLGICEGAQASGARAIFFGGHELAAPRDNPANIVYDLARSDHVDAFVVWGAQLSHAAGRHGAERIRALCARYNPRPIVNIGLDITGLPSLSLDQRQGMKAAVLHLIDVHGRRRIALLQGAEGHLEAWERYQGYVDALSQRDLPLDPALIASWHEVGAWSQRDPERWAMTRDAGIHVLLDAHHLQPSVDFDAIVGQSDELSWAAIQELHRRGYRVPDDVSVISFDDLPPAQYRTPPLTSVRYAFRELGQQAAQLAIGAISGQALPAQIRLPMRLIVRQSCGCQHDPLGPAAKDIPRATHAEEGPGAWPSIIAQVMITLQASPGGGGERWRDRVSRLVEACAVSATGAGWDPFLALLREMSRESLLEEEQIWHALLTALRQQIMARRSQPTAADEEMWHRARMIISETSKQRYVSDVILATQRAQRIHELSAELTTTFEITRLMEIFASAMLPRLPITACAVALYEEPRKRAEGTEAPEWSRRILTYYQHQQPLIGAAGERFRTHELAPPDMLRGEVPSMLLIEPLHSHREQLGFIVFHLSANEGMPYQSLAHELSGAIHGALLVQQVRAREHDLQQAHAELERRVAERTMALAEANARLEIEIAERKRASAMQQELEVLRQVDRLRGELLGNVSHELRTPLGLILVMATALRDRTLQLDEATRSSFLADIEDETHKLQAIVDNLLDASRLQHAQIRLHLDTVDLRPLIRKTMERLALQAPQHRIVVRELPDTPLMAAIDTQRVEQVLRNLIDNAVKYAPAQSVIEVHGRLVATTIQISVSDTGPGIPPEQRERIFEQFYRLETIGPPGLGLGLAICHAIITAHGGAIWVEGRPAGGSVFTIALPIASGERDHA